MKRALLSIIAAVVTMAAAAQTLNVEVGSVVYQFPAAQAGQMTYADGTTLTIVNKVYPLAEISRMYVDDTEVRTIP